MKTILLTRGKFAKVDDEDFAWLSHRSWSCHKTGYAYGKLGKMHRVIMGHPELDVDHINGDKLDNRRENLRLATRSQNVQNTPARSGKEIALKGVSRDRNSFRARITLNQKTIFLGSFKTAQEAHNAYCAAAPRLFGEYARTA